MLSDSVILALIGAVTGVVALALKLWRSSSCEILYCCGGSPFHVMYCKRNTDHEKEIIPVQNVEGEIMPTQVAESPRKIKRLGRQTSISNINIV